MTHACACHRLRTSIRQLCREHQRVVLAVSGGVDSMCLMHAIADSVHMDCHCDSWAPDALQATYPLVVTIDHGLRTDSSAEVEFVVQYARYLGLHALPLALHMEEGKKSSLMASARGQRYNALATAALRAQATAVVTAHHAGTFPSCECCFSCIPAYFNASQFIAWSPLE
jgi:tRNA(Ile)-lysidine synthase